MLDHKLRCAHTDIDECIVMPDLCRENGVCTDTSGSYTCGCLEGYEREGELCTSECSIGIRGLCVCWMGKCLLATWPKTMHACMASLSLLLVKEQGTFLSELLAGMQYCFGPQVIMKMLNYTERADPETGSEAFQAVAYVTVIVGVCCLAALMLVVAGVLLYRVFRLQKKSKIPH